MRRTILLAAVFAGLASAPLAAQIRPLPKNPLVRQPTLSAEALAMPVAPSGTVLIPLTKGTGPQSQPDIRLEVETAGGLRNVTLSLEVTGADASRITLVDPPAIGSLAGQPILAQQPMAGQLDVNARKVRKFVRVSGAGSLPQVMPEGNVVTLIARDASGAEVRRSFTIKFTRAAARPNPLPIASATQVRRTERYPTATQPQIDLVPGMEVSYVEYNTVDLRSQTGTNLNWFPDDPGSEAICLYGTFRYACDTEGVSASGMRVRVPDIGRSGAIRIVLKGPYGESAPVEVRGFSSQLSRFTREFVDDSGNHRISPGISELEIIKNGATRPCDKPYLVWNDLKNNGKVFFTPPPHAPFEVNLGLAGERSVRIISVPRGQVITTNPSTHAEVAVQVPPTLTNWNATDYEYVLTTRIGECPARRR